VFRLPPYAHELNLVESAGSCPRGSPANRLKHNFAGLTALVRIRLERMRTAPRSSPVPDSTSDPCVTPLDDPCAAFLKAGR